MNRKHDYAEYAYQKLQQGLDLFERTNAGHMAMVHSLVVQQNGRNESAHKAMEGK